MAGIRQRKILPLENVNPAKIAAFTRALQTKLRDPESNFGKDYLHLLIDEITITGDQAAVRGSYAAMAEAIAEMKMGTQRVPTSVIHWRA